MYSSSSRYSLCSVSEALAWASSTFFFTEWRQGFPDPASVAIFRFGVVCQAFRHLEYLRFSFGTLLATFDPGVFFSVTTMPSSSTLWENSIDGGRSPVGFGSLVNLSTCLVSSVRHLRRWRTPKRFGFQSFDDHPACLWSSLDSVQQCFS